MELDTEEIATMDTEEMEAEAFARRESHEEDAAFDQWHAEQAARQIGATLTFDQLEAEVYGLNGQAMPF